MEIAAPPTVDFEVDIGRAEMDFYARNGYLVIDAITTADEVAWMRDAYACLLTRTRSGLPNEFFDVTRPYGSLASPSIGQLLMPERFVPQIRATALWRNARRIAARLLEVPLETVEHWGHLIFKAANDGGETPWHQDEAYWNVHRDYHAIAAWTPMQHVDESNGCLWFLPGSHLGPVVAHRHVGDDPSVHILELAERIDTEGAVAVPLMAGGMSFHHPRLLHYAGPNRTNRPRLAWANEFQTAPVQRSTPADRPWVLEGEAALARAMRT